MRKSRFTEERIVAILKEHTAGAKTAELIRRHGISRETFYKWRRKYGDHREEMVPGLARSAPMMADAELQRLLPSR
jgi:transposase-like protein